MGCKTARDQSLKSKSNEVARSFSYADIPIEPGGKNHSLRIDYMVINYISIFAFVLLQDWVCLFDTLEYLC